MHPLPTHPRLRAIDLAPLPGGAESRGRSWLLTDPAGFLEAPLELSGAALLLLALCDGTRDHATICDDYAARSRQSLSAAELAEFLASMDQQLLLDSPRFAAHRDRLRSDWLAQEWRPAAHAGGAYEGDANALAGLLDGWLAAAAPAPPPAGRLRALVAPHIDFHRGGSGYGRSYARLLEFELPEVVVLLGTGHGADEGRFIVTEKGFETPLGRLAVDRPLLGRLEQSLPRDHRRGELAHRQEHSLEFQAVWLAHLARRTGAPPPSIVPILCTSFDDLLEPGAGPLQEPEARDFLCALRGALAAEPRRVLVVVGADLAHVGPRFGDPRPLDAAQLDEVRGRDEVTLAAFASASPQRFLESVARHRNRDRICSVAGLYAALFAVEARAGERLVYDQASEPGGALAVTFGGAALYGDDGGPGLRRTIARRSG